MSDLSTLRRLAGSFITGVTHGIYRNTAATRPPWNKDKIVGRIRLISKDRMEDQMTMQDPVALAHPWKVTRTFKRMKGVDRLVPRFYQVMCVAGRPTPVTYRTNIPRPILRRELR